MKAFTVNAYLSTTPVTSKISISGLNT